MSRSPLSLVLHLLFESLMAQPCSTDWFSPLHSYFTSHVALLNTRRLFILICAVHMQHPIVPVPNNHKHIRSTALIQSSGFFKNSSCSCLKDPTSVSAYLKCPAPRCSSFPDHSALTNRPSSSQCFFLSCFMNLRAGSDLWARCGPPMLEFTGRGGREGRWDR